MALRHIQWVFFLIFFLTFYSGWAQNAKKYWQYRSRLAYFVMPGNEPGQSQLINIRNRCADHPEKNIYRHDAIVYGQTYTRCGFYTGMLATEYFLLKGAGNDSLAKTTLKELDLALEAFIRTDNCETGPPWFLPNNRLDGFCIRSDAPAILSSQMTEWFNRGLSSQNSVQKNIDDRNFGWPAWVDPTKVESNRQYDSDSGYFNVNWQSEKFTKADYLAHNNLYLRYWKIQTFNSQDEVLGALIGLVLTVKLVDDEQIRNKAADIALRMIAFFADCPNCRENEKRAWYPCFPDSSRLGNLNGGDARAFAYPMVQIAQFIGKEMPNKMQSPEMQRILSAPDKRAIFSATIYSTRFSANRSNRYLSCISLALSNCRSSSERSFRSLYRISEYNNWDTFYLLLLFALHPETKTEDLQNYNFQKLNEQLSNAPEYGTYSYSRDFPGAEGWSSDIKWTSTIGRQNGDEPYTNSWSLGNFSGIDYMLLHNLALIVFPDSFPPIDAAAGSNN